MQSWQATLERGDKGEINSLARQFLENSGYRVLTLAQMAIMAYQRGYFDVSALFFEKVRTFEPENSELRFNLALAYFNAGRFPAAKEELEAFSPPERTAEIYHLLGKTYQSLGLSDEAFSALQKASELDPEREAYYLDVGFWYVRHSLSETATDFFDRGKQRFPGSERLLLALGTAQTLGEQYERALRTFLEVVALYPQSSRAYILLAEFAFSSRHYQPPIPELMKRFSELSPENYLSHYYYARILFETRNSEVGSGELIPNLLSKSIDLNPDFYKSHFLLAHWHKTQGRYPQAIRHYRRALELNPEVPEAYYHLAQIHRERGEWEEAREALVRFQQLKKKESDDLLSEGEKMRQLIDSPLP
ncbi:tetratricopeptide repeat protein [Acidobacteria bacterium AH-259-D05]|nr:tetratricopeptide repeat protein [Acidobacteria bacterium AH-259-D05]